MAASQSSTCPFLLRPRGSRSRRTRAAEGAMPPAGRPPRHAARRGLPSRRAAD
ncbi:hypothetical protein STXM2123_425 [Streptomyces sp. F-3]|nr:hypothetical protein STXM2123_425 [Streptomyces sp. F-3]